MLLLPLINQLNMYKYILFIGLLALCSCAGTSLKKRISDPNFRYEFYTTEEKVSARPEREYFWFKGGLIHNSEYGAAGELLHTDYVKYYHSNQLAEAGKYKIGLKQGYWKTWFDTGVLQSKTYWSKGQKDGSYYGYDQTGHLIEAGRYKNNKKHGRWINHVSKDTIKYRRGEVVIKKLKEKTPKKEKRQKEKKNKKQNTEVGKKKTLLGRIFSKIGGWFKKKNPGK